MTYFVDGLSKHFDPASQGQRIGEYQTLAEAIAAAEHAIDGFLHTEYRPSMDAEALFTRYQAQGVAPFIFRDEDKTLNVRCFNHAQYAMSRAAVICGRKK